MTIALVNANAKSLRKLKFSFGGDSDINHTIIQLICTNLVQLERLKLVSLH